MPHASFKIKPGVDQNETPALNEAGISTSNFIRFIFDRNGEGLVQKLGGWAKFYPNPMVAKVRALWGWEDTNARSWLGIGTENQTGAHAGQAQLAVLNSGSLKDITPRYGSDNVTPSASTTAGSAQVIITDTTTQNLTFFDSVYIPIQMSVGKVVLFGLYQCDPDYFQATNSYSIYNKDVLGNISPVPVSNGSATAAFTASISGQTMTVSSISSGTIEIGQKVTGTGVAPGTVIIGGNGPWTVSISQTVSSTSMTSDFNAFLPFMSVTNASNEVVVTLPFHGYSVGDTFPVLVGTTLNGIDFLGGSSSGYDYTIVEVLNSCQFKILASSLASATGSAFLNSGNQRYVYSFGVGATASGTSYGYGAYGSGLYGGLSSTPAVLKGNPIPANNWTLDNWGNVFLSCPTYQNIISGGPQFEPIYQWDPESGSPTATVLYNAPPVNEGMFVAMPQRQIIAWGSTFTGVQDPLLIRWCDVNNYDVWVAQITNQAGSYRIPKGSKIVGAIQGPQQGLIWTDLGVWAMQYIGPPYVYSFNELGTGCGLIAKKAAASLNGIVYWMGPSQFFSLSSNGVESVACPIWDVIFQNLDTANLDKIRVAVNSRFGEITWYYPTKGTTEVNAYAKYNALLRQWDFGTIGRSAWIDQSVLGAPIGADPNTLLLYQHEVSNGVTLTDADGQPMNSSFQTGYFAMSEADLKMFVDQVWPDMKWGFYGGTQNATVNLTFYVTDYAGQTPTVYGPYPMTQSTTFITPRFRGRLVSIGIDSNDLGSFWRIGNIRYRLQQDGKF